MSQRWLRLGHAMWLCEVAGLRLLFDPILGETLHGGVFVHQQGRRIRPEGPRADFILVSHRHPDHFDVPSLAALARADAESVVITPDALVARTCRALGFTTVHQVGEGQRIELDGVTLITTPSHCAVDEWGVLVATADTVVWNQVDTVMREPADVVAVREAAAAGLERPGLAIDLLLARWQPLREIEAQLCRGVGFPLRDWAQVVEQIAALGARAVVPSSAGLAHAPPWGWLNRIAHPVSRARAVADLARRCPRAQVLDPGLGATLLVTAAGVRVEETEPDWIERTAETAVDYAPFSIPPLADPGNGRPVGALLEVVDRWLETILAPALESLELGAWVGAGGRSLQLVLVDEEGGQHPRCFRLGTRCVVDPSLDPEWDVINHIGLAMMAEVIEGRRHWGEPLLAGQIRALSRARVLHEGGLEAAPVGIVFPYYGLSYDRSQERQVDHEVRRLSVSGDQSVGPV